MFGILFGAGASFGSEPEPSIPTPPLGRDLFAQIKEKLVGPRLRIDVMHRLYGDHWQMYGVAPAEALTAPQTIEQWVKFVSNEALQAFSGGDFEMGMKLIADSVDARRAEYLTTHLMSPINEYDGSTLPFRIMAEVASALHKFRPSFSNLYFEVLDALPNGSHVATLNYDALVENVAVWRRINLLEPASVSLKTIFQNPTKELNYYQLHGGVTLLSLWQGRSGLPPDMVMHSDVQRANAAMWAFSLANGRGEAVVHAPEETYEEEKDRAVLSYYHPNKTTVICPNVIDDIQQAFRKALGDSISALIVIGCRFTPHDTHIWKSIEEFGGDVYWVGSEPTPPNKNLKVIGSRFGDSLALIKDVIKSANVVP
ncbi:hypothetical protein [Rhodoferax sp.]|uniref:hypothetical protein n=1 Tax=Rhodoferax sp. TaxID=50421 RepID=UPI0027232A12|nr:hypothetical protein [Rhodoferax sp.]MDO8319157.1 hypothetical protein [Rhodoferax sp.]MDP2680379.1 hypothetical protein [Rhodoferax sp.]